MEQHGLMEKLAQLPSVLEEAILKKGKISAELMGLIMDLTLIEFDIGSSSLDTSDLGERATKLRTRILELEEEFPLLEEEVIRLEKEFDSMLMVATIYNS